MDSGAWSTSSCFSVWILNSCRILALSFSTTFCENLHVDVVPSSVSNSDLCLCYYHSYILCISVCFGKYRFSSWPVCLTVCLFLAVVAPMKTAVGLAAVWEPCLSRDYGTSGELQFGLWCCCLLPGFEPGFWCKLCMCACKVLRSMPWCFQCQTLWRLKEVQPLVFGWEMHRANTSLDNFKNMLVWRFLFLMLFVQWTVLG